MAKKKLSEAQALALETYRKNRRSFQFWAMPEQYEMFEAAKEQYEWRNGKKISYADFFTVLCKTYLNHE